MGQFPSSGGGGGGSSIYKDGDPVLEEVFQAESLTIPSGEIWVVTVVIRDAIDFAPAKIDNAVIEEQGSNGAEIDYVLPAGTTLSCGESNGDGPTMSISGWSI